MGMLLTEWTLNLVDMAKNLGPARQGLDDDTGKVVILTAGSPTSPTVYTDRYGTALATTAGLAQLTFTNGRIRFYTAQSVTSVDVSGITASGHAIGVSGLAANTTHVETVYKNGRGEHIFALPFGANNNSELDTGFDLIANCLVKDVWMKVTGEDATETIDLGLLSSESGGDADGLILAASVATAGYVNMWPVVTGGSNIDYVVHTAGYGALLKQGIAGADAVATVGGFTRRYHATSAVTAKSLSYTGSAGSDTAAGYFYIQYVKMAF